MKILFKAIPLIAAVFFIASCNNPQGEKAKTGEAKAPEKDISNVEIVNLDLEKSIIEWIGTKPTGQHNGTIAISKGSFKLSDGNLIGGKFAIDFNSINVLDIEDKDMNAKLKGHLMSPDFFDVENNPTGMFLITSIEDYDGEALEDGLMPTHMITGNLSMKGITKSVSFPAIIAQKEGILYAKTPKFKINRAEWNIQYGSRSFFDNLKDNFIHDEIVLKIDVQAAV